MYSGYGGGATTMNNPFAPNPNSIQSRFPDIAGGIDPQYGSSQPQGFQQQQQQQQPQYQQPQQPQFQQQPMYQQPQPTGMPLQQQYGGGGGATSPTYSGFLSPAPQQVPQQTGWMGPQVSGSSYSYLNGAQQPQYTPAQQQIQNNPGYVAQFDPYASIGQGWEGPSSTSQSANNQSAPTPTTTTTSAAPAGVSHPRDYIRANKSMIDSWDPYAWKQLISSFESVKDSWASRKRELEQKVQQFTLQMQYGGGGYHPMQIQQEIGRLQGLIKEADSHSDTAAAASFQLSEVFENYRKSGDLASKKRIRDACNATLSGCPDWPPAIY